MADFSGFMDVNPNLLDPAVRRDVIQDIKSEDNRSRKREQQKRFDIYRERQDRYIIERLEREFSQKTVNEMRKVLSINLSKRIIDEMSSIYNMPPTREFVRESGVELTEEELAQLQALYVETGTDVALRQGNRYYNLQDQTAIMVVPDMEGKIRVKALPMMHFDVIPDAVNPEKAYAYILNVWDFDLHKSFKGEDSEPTQLNRYRSNNKLNESIADDNDRKSVQDRYVVWTADVHFVMDGRGDIKGEIMPNPIGKLPFVDVAAEKDFQFFVRRGSGVVDFALDFGVLLSDLSNIIRLQGYSQAVIKSEKVPTNTIVGVNHVLWLQQDPNRPELNPDFQFVSPSPDIAGSLEYIENILRLFLSSRGIEPGTISGKGEGKSFSSGIERLLAMLDKFEATRSDFSVFKRVEKEVFELLVAWGNVFQNVSPENALMPSLMKATIPEDTSVEIKFHEPQMIQTQSEMEDSAIKLMENGLMSRREAIMMLREVGEEKADQILAEIDELDQEEKENNMQNLPPQLQQENEESEEEEDLEDEEENGRGAN